MNAGNRTWCLGIIPLLLVGLFAGCKNDAPPHAFEGLLQRLPDRADAWLMLDAQAAAGRYQAFWQELRQLPLCKAEPHLEQQLDDLQAIVNGGLVLAKTKLGFDPLKDLEKIAAAVVFDPKADPRMVVVVKGKLPADTPKRLFPEAREEKRGQQLVYVTPGDGPDLAMLAGDMLILADKSMMDAALKPKKLPEAVKKKHPCLQNVLGKDFVLRLSVHMPGWLGDQLHGMTQQPGVTALMGLKLLEIEWNQSLRMALVGVDTKGADHAEDLLAALAELNVAGHWALRSAVQLLLAAELEAIEEIPTWLAKALEDPKPWLASMDRLSPKSAAAPEVSREGHRVALKLKADGLQAMVVWALPIAMAIFSFGAPTAVLPGLTSIGNRGAP
ncbi:MAG: hypothetical protein JRF33_21150 [Deltaproteobacteria bacterium]|nr:hypothetical protein [Deltaproteobacteria bacterium]